MSQFYRKISERLLAIAKQFPTVILTGARQTGKTTLSKQRFPKSHEEVYPNYGSIRKSMLASITVRTLLRI